MVGQPWRFPHANSPADYCLMVVEYVANGLGEELVTRAYLITRLERLCGSRAAAVGLSALLFGAYHLYYGFWTGLVCITFMGLFFGGLYLLVRRLWPFALAHALVNIATVLAYSTGPA